MNAAQRCRVESLTNIFENSTPQPQYGYAEDLGDGRGISFGRCGFCSGTGDGLAIVQEYTKLCPNNPLASYLPALERINAEKQGESNPDTTGLDGFAAAVESLDEDQNFRNVQDLALEELYWNPSQRTADSLGLKLALSRGQIFDAFLMHGENDPEDSFYPQSANGMVEWTKRKLGGNPADGIDEKLWLDTYLEHRKSVLESSDEVWSAAVNRIEIYQWLAKAKEYDLLRPIMLVTGPSGASGFWDIVSAGPSEMLRLGPCIYGNLSVE